MAEENVLIGNEYFGNILNEAINNAKSGNGSIIIISGEAGFGKTYLLNHYHNIYKTGSSGIRSVFAEGQSPIGKFNVGNLQPLYPFSKAIEHLLEKNDITPEKRFAKNVGLTLLASIPLIDTVFYAVKEIGRDWRQFKNEKSSEKAKKVSTATADYYDTLQSFADKFPFIFFMDDMHWADSQSVELISLLAENLADIPIVLVLAYKRSTLEMHGMPLMSFIMNYKDRKTVSSIELDSFSKAQISELAASYFKNYKHIDEFEEWIFEHSYGVPGVAAEYLKYFQKYPPFDDSGNLVMNFKGNEFLPSTVQSVFTQHLDTLSDEERNILAICSSEGREFTAVVVSQLMNTDVLTAIKKLKSLQTKTGIIKSIGPEHRYGIKTTVFKFSQAFYHTYFENSLEYEEYTALHGQIAAFLKTRYEQTDNESLKVDIAPYLAAHSIESGDRETAKSMLLESAKNAQKYGNPDTLKNAFQQFREFETDNETDNLNNLEFMQMLGNYSNAEQVETSVSDSNNAGNDSAFDDSLLDFKLYVKSITSDILSNKFESAIDKTDYVLSKLDNELNSSERIQLNCLKLKCLGEVRDLKNAEDLVFSINEMLKISKNVQSECLAYNTIAGYFSQTGNMPKVFYYLDKTANLSNELPQELRLLTLANIAINTKNSTPDKSAEYLRAALKLSNSLNYYKLSEELAEL
ncbi:MAG: AAA family ATPase [Candidatus Kapabacteria bacterium]|nr:AAA family ATPase [Ignavibacteriota bacterium]MCW5884739.1 AAA family ATPase [Candidatus Kapabacteria bacterium]